MDAQAIKTPEKRNAVRLAVNACGGGETVAQMCGVTRQAVALWCQLGYIPNVRHLLKVARVAGVEAERLLKPEAK